MTTTSPFLALFKSNVRAWLTAKGFWLVLGATLLPVVFIGAWALTHGADVGVAEFRIPDGPFTEGDNLTISASFKNFGDTPATFNATIAILEGGQFRRGQERATLSLAPGESKDLSLNWTSTPGAFLFVANADVGQELGAGDIGERDENNNQVLRVIEVRYAKPTNTPPAPAGVAGATANETSSVDLVVESVTWIPERPLGNDNVTVVARLRNAGSAPVENATANVKIITIVNGRPSTLRDDPQTITLAAGETTTVQVVWRAQLGPFWAEGSILPPPGAKEQTPDNNYVQQALVIDPVVDESIKDQVERPERATFKTYYETILLGFYIMLVIPMIALFYAGGVIQDERENGALPYVLTRPIPRWLIPIAKFLAGFLVAGLAVVIAMLASYALMFGTVQDASSLGFLAGPLTLSLIALAAYLALFTALGTWSTRPYVIGLLFVLAWETVAARLQVVAETATGPVTQPLLPWVGNLTVLQHLSNAVTGWDLDAGLSWLPEGPDAMRAVYVLAGIAIGGLVAASYWMRQRDFQVG